MYLLDWRPKYPLKTAYFEQQQAFSPGFWLCCLNGAVLKTLGFVFSGKTLIFWA